MSEENFPPIPLFIAPDYHGSRDPEIVWNPGLRRWFFYYTASRVLRDPGYDLLSGTPVGVASSTDWREWKFEGYCSFDGKNAKPDSDYTYWAPALVAAEDGLHMFVLHRGPTRLDRGGESEGLFHYTASFDAPLTWTNRGPIFPDADGMDAGVYRVGDEWHLYYRSYTADGRDNYFATSTDLFHWTRRGPVAGDPNNLELHGMGYQEGQYPFQWKGAFWLLTDPFGFGKGLALYRSEDAHEWKYLGRVLDEPGSEPTDASHARHPSVAVVEDRAFIFYHIEPHRDYSITPLEAAPPQTRRTYVQLAELTWNGVQATALRPGSFQLPSREMVARGQEK